MLLVAQPSPGRPEDSSSDKRTPRGQEEDARFASVARGQEDKEDTGSASAARGQRQANWSARRGQKEDGSQENGNGICETTAILVAEERCKQEARFESFAYYCPDALQQDD